MMYLRDGMFLYHASYVQIKKIDLGFCTEGLDFGRGFYMTSSHQQAYDYVPQAVKKWNYNQKKDKKICPEDGWINVFRYHKTETLGIYYFNEADTNWLHFVAGHRDNKLFPEIVKLLASEDVIGGKIADDQTRRTLTAYINGVYGELGSLQTDQITLEMLLPNRLKDQFCFRTERSLKNLEFVRGERYGDIARPTD